MHKDRHCYVHRLQSVELYIDSEVGLVLDTLGSVREDCMWVAEQYQNFIHALGWEANDILDEFYNTVYDVYTELVEVSYR